MNGLRGRAWRRSGGPVGVTALVVVVCALVTSLATVLSAWLGATDDAMAGEAFTSEGYRARQLQVYYSAVTDPEVPADAAGRLHASLPPAVAGVLRPPRHSVATLPGIPQTVPRTYIGATAYLTVVGLPDSEGLVEAVRGRLPRPGSPVRALPPASAAEYDGPNRVHLVEVALHEQAAALLGIEVGSILDVNPIRYGGTGGPLPTLLRVVGTYRPAGPERSALDDADFARRPAVTEVPDLFIVRAAALAADDLTVLGASWSLVPEVRFTFDPARVPAAGEAEELGVQARTLAVQPWPEVVNSESVAAVTGLGDLASTYLGQRTVSEDVVSLLVAVAGWAAVVVLWALAVVLARRRRTVTRLLRARGAGVARLAGLRLREALLLVLPGVLLAAGLAALTAVELAHLVVGLGVAGVCVLVLVAGQMATLVAVPARFAVPVRDGVHAAVVLLAAALAVWVWRSGQVSPPRAALVVLPALVAFAAAIVVVRTSGWAGRLLRGRLGGRSLTGWLTVAHVGNTLRDALVPVTALVLAASAAVLPLALTDTMTRGAERLATEAVGADLQLVGQFDAAAVEALERLDGVERVAAVYEADASLGTSTGLEGVRLVAVDRDDYREVLGPTGPDLSTGGAADPLSVVVSDDLTLADDATLAYAQAEVAVRAAGSVPSVPGLGGAGPFVVVDAGRLREATERRLLRADRLLVSGPADPQTVLARAQESWPPARVTVWADEVAERLGAGVAERSRLVAWGVAAAAAVAALAGALMLVARDHAPRRYTGAVLAALGGGTRQRRRFETLAAGSVLGIAVLTAGLTAAALVVLLRPVVDVAVLVDAVGAGPLALAPSPGTALVLLLVAAAAVTTGALVVSRGPGPTAPADLSASEEGS